MSTAARIDELRKKFEENPRRYFAPLANEYRKSGDLEQAIALCREHLPKQPGHMSGYIVFGQALYEAGEMGEARTVFEQALALDPENLIALRHLGDIARASGDAPGARRWYERVLDADPRNDDIAAQLATLATGQTPVSVPSVAPPYGRQMETPPIPMTPIGFGVMPTPDSAMRAVDMDAINERVVRSTPMALSAFATPMSVPAQPATAGTPAEPMPPMVRPADAEPIDVSDWGADAVVERAGAGTMDEAAAVPADGLADPFAFPSAEPSLESEHGDVESAAERSADDEAFEEGLVAPEWPEAAEIVARFATPRSVTPRSLTPHAATPRSVTPASSEAVGDAIAAFGREAHDDLVSDALVDEHTSVRANADATPISQPAYADADVEQPAFDPPALFVPTNAAASYDRSHDVDETPVPPVPDVVSHADTWADVATIGVADAAAHVVAEVAEDVVADAESSDRTGEPDQTFGAAATETPAGEWSADASSGTTADDVAVVAAESVDAEFAVAESVETIVVDETATEELPWLSVSEPSALDHAHDAQEPGLQEIAEAFAEDARAAGDAETLVVEALDQPASFDSNVDGQAADDEAFGLVTSEYESFDVFDGSDAVESTSWDASDADATLERVDEAPLNLGASVDASDALRDQPAAAASYAPTPATGSTAFVTETMAELLVSQGFVARAVDVYEELARRNPSDPAIAARLTEVRGMLTSNTDTNPLAASAGDEESAFADGVEDVFAESFGESFDESVDEGMDEGLDAWNPAALTSPTPATGTPAFGTPAYGTPASETPSLGFAAFDGTRMPTPAHATAHPTPALNTPILPVAAIADAGWTTPPRVTPYAQPAIGEESIATGRTAREWFAALAARRVPRRTPAQPMSPIESPADGLSSLFGTDPSSQDDEAARALADAFAPVTSADLAAGAALDFEFARTTPTFSPVVATSMTPAMGTIAQTSAPSMPDERTGGGSNAGFSFDKFFPDPAARRETPAAGASETPSAPVTDDLAQFSAWLKGLGNT
ncbi:MAG: tetratricopeptide repeat protein [Gemmatimonadaceae bacterium]|nr:tetratricopeptide repeat protein [Gemmatimonadaceae bacterium]